MKNVFLLLIIALIGFAATFVFFFLNNPGVPLGWLLGSLIEIAGYLSIVKGTSFLLDPNHLNRKRSLLAPLFMILRVLVYGGGLVLAALSTFRWGSISSCYLHLFSLVAAYLPVYVLLLFTTIYRLKKEPKKEEVAPVEQVNNGEEND